jgi:hypothetical protein
MSTANLLFSDEIAVWWEGAHLTFAVSKSLVLLEKDSRLRHLGKG